MIRSYGKAIAGIVIGLALIRGSKPGGWAPLNNILWLILAGMLAFALGVAAFYWRLRRPPAQWESEYADSETRNAKPEDIEGVERKILGSLPANAAMPGMWRLGLRLVGGQVASDVAFYASKAAPPCSRILARGARIPGRVSKGFRGGVALGAGLAILAFGRPGDQRGDSSELRYASPRSRTPGGIEAQWLSSKRGG